MKIWIGTEPQWDKHRERVAHSGWVELGNFDLVVMDSTVYVHNAWTESADCERMPEDTDGALVVQDERAGRL